MIYPITYYAVQHRPTGFYLPEPHGRKKASHVEPREPGMSGGCIPRLFHSERTATLFLTSWLKGRVVVIPGPYHPDTPEDDGDRVVVERVPSRRAEDMRIVPFTIKM